MCTALAVLMMRVQAWDERHGVCCAGVQWEILAKEDLCDLAVSIGKSSNFLFGHVSPIHGLLTPWCAGPRALCGVASALARDYRARSGGFPDVMLWPAGGGSAGSCCLLEVKSPNDRLSPKQHVSGIVWMAVEK